MASRRYRRKRKRRKRFPGKKIILWFFILFFGIGIYWIAYMFWWKSISQKETRQEAVKLHQISVRLYRENRLVEALSPAQSALTILEDEMGMEHPELTKVLYTLALIYRYQKNISAAERVYNRILTIQENSYGKDDLGVGKALYEMASVFISKHNYANAEKLLNRAITIFENGKKYDHNYTIKASNRLVFSYQSSGKWKLAASLQKKIRGMQAKHINLQKKTITEKNIVHKGGKPREEKTDKGLITLAEAKNLTDQPRKLYKSGKYVEAVNLGKRILYVFESNLGTEHPLVAIGLTNLGFLYQNWGTYKVAAYHYRRALNIRKKALGLDHPLVAQSFNNLAMVYQAQGRFREAEPLFHKSLSILEKKNEPDHKAIVRILDNLARMAEKQKKMKQSTALKKRAKEFQAR